MENQKNILITGATGMVGSEVLERLLEREDVKVVHSLVRKSTGLTHPKLVEHIHQDFSMYAENAAYLKKIDHAFFCIGVYTGAVDRELFRAITIDYPVNLAAVLKEQSPNASFSLLSGQGADRSEKSRIMFAKDKGIAENRLSQIFKGSFKTFRPGYIHPSKPREAPTLSYKVMTWFYPLIKLLGSATSILSGQLASAMIEITFSNSEKEEWENKEMINYFKKH